MVNLSGGSELLNPQKIFQAAGLAAGMKFADLGCGGAGHFVIPAAGVVGDKGVVYAVDILKSVLQAVSTRARIAGYHNFKTVWSNLEQVGATRVPAQSLDVALLINVLHQAHDQAAMMKEAGRLLKKDGKLVVADWQGGKIPFGPSPEKRVKPADIKRMAQAASLKLTSEFVAGPHHFGLLFSKG